MSEVAIREDRPVQRVAAFLERVLLVVVCCGLGLISMMSLFTTVIQLDDIEGQLSQNMWVLTWFGGDAFPIIPLGLLSFVGFIMLCWGARRPQGFHGRAVLVPLVIGTTLAQVIILLIAHSWRSIWGDSWMISDFVERAVTYGLPSLSIPPAVVDAAAIDHEASLYFSCYPFQCGLFWYFYALRSVFGNSWYLVAQLVNVAANELAMMCLLGMGHVMLARRPQARRVLIVLVAFAFPMWWLSGFVYGNSLGTALGLLFLLWQVRAMSTSDRQRRIHLVTVSVVPLAVGLIIKSTIILFAIASVLAWAIICLSRRDVLTFVAMIAVVVIANSVAKIPTFAYSQATGTQLTEGMSTLNHLELGLRDDVYEFSTQWDSDEPDVSPGGWSRHAMNVWLETRYTPGAQNAAAMANISADLSRMASDLPYTAWFFSNKLICEWADPVYQSLYYLSCGYDETATRFDPTDLNTGTGVGTQALAVVLDGWQLAVYAGALYGVLTLLRLMFGRMGGRAILSHVGRLAPWLLMVTCFFTGFGCYLLWEAKSVYLLPFVLLLLPLSALGIDNAIRSTERVRLGGEDIQAIKEGDYVER